MSRSCHDCGGAVGKWARRCGPCNARRHAKPPKPVYTCSKCGAPRHRQSAGLCGRCVAVVQAIAYRPIRRATAIVHHAVKLGRLPSPKTLRCADCGNTATEYDHRDYSKPLQVEPVCHPCNQRRGPGLRGQAVA